MAQVETKVQASTAAAAVSGLALWALGHYVFKSGVPDVVASWTYVIVPAVITFGAGYLAKHTDRPPTPSSPVPPAVAAQIAHSRAYIAETYGSPDPPAVPPEKTLIPPAAAETEPPAAAGDPPA